ncbi:hypothetical protein DENSPDRAFT_833474 [Dentipellis sp. KUC8613]|nr:hypothetical protein DENSPDRAFT_833474 [Dentipellis sp. KUC8613]
MSFVLRQVSRRAVPAMLRPVPATTPSRVVRPAFLNLSRTLVTKKFTEDHEAVLYDDETKIGTIMITDYAQKSLGDVVFVELPTEEVDVEKGAVIGAVESVKAASDIFSPLTGKVIEINGTLDDSPSLLNKSPEDKGWLCKIQASNPAELDELMSEEEYKKHCEE